MAEKKTKKKAKEAEAAEEEIEETSEEAVEEKLEEADETTAKKQRKKADKASKAKKPAKGQGGIAGSGNSLLSEESEIPTLNNISSLERGKTAFFLETSETSGESGKGSFPRTEGAAEAEDATEDTEESSDKKSKRKAKKEKDAEEELEVIDEEEAYTPKPKPALDGEMQKRLELRKRRKSKQPEFKRQEWYRFSRLGESYRRPKGLHSKRRMGLKYRPAMVSIGYGGPKETRGLHPSGFQEVIVHNTKELEGVDPKFQAVRIGGTVGNKKRAQIHDKADELGIRVLNRREL